MKITVEIDRETPEVQIFLDHEGLALLKQEIDRLAQREPSEHFHLFSENWGGQELTDKAVQDKAICADHLKVTLLYESQFADIDDVPQW